MVDGLVLGKMTILAAMDITSDGKKQILGSVEGGSEKVIVVTDLFTDLIARDLDPLTPRLFVIDRGKALRKAILQ